MTLKRILAPLAALTLTLILGGGVARAADTSIGYVNLARALLEVDEGKRAMTRIKKVFDKKQVELLAEEKKLKALQESLQAQSSVVKDDATARAKRAEFETKVMELQQRLMQEQETLERLKAKELNVIREKMQKVISKIGKSGKYTIILEVQDSRLLYAKPHLDLTNEVIRKYNQSHK